MRLERAAWKNFNFLVPGSDSASILICLACSRTFPGALFCIRIRLCGLPGRFRDVPGTSPKRSQSLAHGCLKPTFERHAPETIKFDVVRLPDVPKTAESDAALCQNASKIVDSGIDFRHFSRCRGMDGSTSRAKCRTSVFTGRRSTFKGSQTLRTNRKATKFNERSLPH